MRTRRHPARLLVALLAALALGACGSSDDSSGSGGSTSADQAGSDASAPADRTGAASFSETPAITACLERAGFMRRPTPPAGAIVSWRGAGGTIAVTDERGRDQLLQTLAGAREVAGTDVVVTGRGAQLEAAIACVR
ncbi:MAG: hypothetical protein JWO69_762 [Thermoleophilia bacterium]|nr:hypothetical protein [Thermoleophilia bacterium]